MNKTDVKERRRTSLRLNEEIYKSVELEAKKLGLSMNGYISMILHKEMRNIG